MIKISKLYKKLLLALMLFVFARGNSVYAVLPNCENLGGDGIGYLATGALGVGATFAFARYLMNYLYDEVVGPNENDAIEIRANVLAKWGVLLPVGLIAILQMIKYGLLISANGILCGAAMLAVKDACNSLDNAELKALFTNITAGRCGGLIP